MNFPIQLKMPLGNSGVRSLRCCDQLDCCSHSIFCKVLTVREVRRHKFVERSSSSIYFAERGRLTRKYRQRSELVQEWQWDRRATAYPALLRILHLHRLSLPTEHRKIGFVSWKVRWPQQLLRTYHRQTYWCLSRLHAIGKVQNGCGHDRPSSSRERLFTLP